MAAQHLVRPVRQRLREPRVRFRPCVDGRAVPPVLERRRRRAPERDLVRPRDRKDTVLGCDRATLRLGMDTRREADGSGDAVHRRAAPGREQVDALLARTAGEDVRAVPKGGERQRTGLRRAEPHDDDVILERRERLPLVRHAVQLVRDPGDRLLERERPPVALREVMPDEPQAERAERLVGNRVAELRDRDLLRDEPVVGGVRSIRENPPPGLRKQILHPGLQPIVRSTGPERVLVQLQALHRGAAVDHRAETSVADRQRLVPVRGGRDVLEIQRPGHRHRRHRSDTQRQHPDLHPPLPPSLRSSELKIPARPSHQFSRTSRAKSSRNV